MNERLDGVTAGFLSSRRSGANRDLRRRPVAGAILLAGVAGIALASHWLLAGLLQSASLSEGAWPLWGTTALAKEPRADAPADEHAKTFARVVQPFVQKHCIGCHGPATQEAGLRFDGPLPDPVRPKVAEHWLAAKRMLSEGRMPPEDEPRPPVDDVIAVLDWIDEVAARAATEIRGGVGRRALRRLTAREYVNTLQDLLKLKFPHALGDLSARLPSDAMANNFSNDSNAQVMQTLQLRRSLDLAEDLLAVALPGEGAVRPLRLDVDLRRLLAEAETDRRKSDGQIRNVKVASEDGPASEPASLTVCSGRKGLRPHQLDPARGVLLDPNPVINGVSGDHVALLLPWVPDRGVLRLRAIAGATREHDDGVPVLRLCLGGQFGPGDVAYPLAEVAVTAPASAPREYELEFPLLLADADWNSFRRQKKLFVQIDNSAASLGPTPMPSKLHADQRDKSRKRNQLLLQSFTLEIEAAEAWPPGSEAVLLAARPGEAEGDRVKRSLQVFLLRAFRRPPEPAEADAFFRLYQAERNAGRDLLAAYRTAIAAALVSPQTYYLIEPKGAQRRPLTAWELASRLSYLVWSTAPDAELLGRAADGSLLGEAELRRQLQRLIADERAFAFARDFTRQWLDLDCLDHLEPAVIRQGAAFDSSEDRRWYDKVIRRDFAAEPAHYLLDMFRHDRPVAELVASDTMFVNERLARYYGSIDARGASERPQAGQEPTDRWRRAAAPEGRRGGLLTQAGAIAAATHGQERGEIKRGVYLVKRMLGIDIPSPPGNVDIKPLDVQLAEDKKLRDLTPRQHMERHRAMATCAVCHQRSDPLGFVWDDYDLFGLRKRNRQGNLLPADTGGSLPDKTPFADFAEFRRLLSTEDRFLIPFSRRLFAYALGRGLDPGDETHLKRIRAAAAKDGGGLRAMLTAIVLSEPFRNK